MKTIGKNFSPLVQICSIWIEHDVVLFLEAKFALSSWRIEGGPLSTTLQSEGKVIYKNIKQIKKTDFTFMTLGIELTGLELE